jgi:N-acetylmuramoyl-L-alanine amidase
MPSILVETGFITNKEEEEYLNSDEGQDEIVSNILSALKKYKAEIETSKATTSN